MKKLIARRDQNYRISFQTCLTCRHLRANEHLMEMEGGGQWRCDSFKCSKGNFDVDTNGTCDQWEREPD